MLRIRFTHRISRRKFVHFIRDPEGRYLFITSKAEEIWLWLLERELHEVVLELPKGEVTLNIGQLRRS